MRVAVKAEKKRLNFVKAFLNLPEILRVNLLTSLINFLVAIRLGGEEDLQLIYKLLEQLLILNRNLAHFLTLFAQLVLKADLHLLQFCQKQSHLVSVGFLVALFLGVVKALKQVFLVHLCDRAFIADIDLTGETSSFLGELMQKTVLALGESVLQLQINELVGFEL